MNSIRANGSLFGFTTSWMNVMKFFAPFTYIPWSTNNFFWLPSASSNVLGFHDNEKWLECQFIFCIHGCKQFSLKMSKVKGCSFESFELNLCFEKDSKQAKTCSIISLPTLSLKPFKHLKRKSSNFSVSFSDVRLRKKKRLPSPLTPNLSIPVCLDDIVQV